MINFHPVIFNNELYRFYRQNHSCVNSSKLVIHLWWKLWKLFVRMGALQMKLCIFILSSLVLLTSTGITLAGDEELSGLNP